MADLKRLYDRVVFDYVNPGGFTAKRVELIYRIRRRLWPEEYNRGEPDDPSPVPHGAAGQDALAHNPNTLLA